MLCSKSSRVGAELVGDEVGEAEGGEAWRSETSAHSVSV